MKINGIVLAAGYGTRLAPLTLQVPKPALPLCGIPLIVRILGSLKKAGVDRIAVNTHHLKEKIEKCVLESEYASSVKLYYEEEILGTAGPLINAKDLLTDCDCFVLHNGDVACDFDLKKIIAQHVKSKASLTMVLIDGPENRVHVEDGRVVDILDKLGVPYSDHGRRLTYACVSVFSPDFFDCLPKKVMPVSFMDAWLRALRTGRKIMAYFPEKGYFWSDIGSFDQYFEAHRKLMPEGGIVKGRRCRIAPDFKVTGFAALGDDCVIPPGTHLRDCILLNGAHVRPGYSAYEVFGKTFSCHRDARKLKSLGIFRNDSSDLRFISLPEQGSDRKFFRVADVFDDTRILMISNAADKDFRRFIHLGKIFHKYDMLTPEIYSADESEFTVLMEDLGDGTLYNLFHGKDPASEDLFRGYADSIRALVTFQQRGRTAIGGEDMEYRIFTHKLLRWESDYFFENFFGGICGIRPSGRDAAELIREFELIASAAEKLSYVPIHRDFQSQNILIHGGKVRFVDFQGSRLGPYTYDIASLVKDPYMDLPKALRERLYTVYFDALNEGGFRVTRAAFDRDSAVGALQRNMQALGAYGFLSLVKGKPRYLQYAEPCLALLREGLAQMHSIHDPDVPTDLLERLCSEAAEKLPGRLEQIRKGLPK